MIIGNTVGRGYYKSEELTKNVFGKEKGTDIVLNLRMSRKIWIV